MPHLVATDRIIINASLSSGESERKTDRQKETERWRVTDRASE